MSLPGILHHWNLKEVFPEDIYNECLRLMRDCKILYDKVGNLPDCHVSFETVLQVLNEAESQMATHQFFVKFPRRALSRGELRDMSNEVSVSLFKFIRDMGKRKDIFHKLVVLRRKKSLPSKAKQYLEKLILSGKRNGLHLAGDSEMKVEEFKNIKPELEKVFIRSITNSVNFEGRYFYKGRFSEIHRIFYPGKCKVEWTLHRYYDIISYCKDPEVRKYYQYKFNEAIVENIDILANLKERRHSFAESLGYANYIAYDTEILMQNKPENSKRMLTELMKKKFSLWENTTMTLLELKEEECMELGIPFDGKINIWDFDYYRTRAMNKYAVDQEKLREYFPFEVVKYGILSIYQSIFGLKIEKVQGEVWHKYVELYRVSDSSSGRLLGYFFLDLFFRHNKKEGFHFYQLQNSFRLPGGSRQVAVCAVVADLYYNEDHPCFLYHFEVIQFFRIFIRVLYHLCMEVEFAYFSKMDKKMDFLMGLEEMVENWCWEKESLKKMSCHYRDGSEIPDDVLNNLRLYRIYRTEYETIRDIIGAVFYQRLYSYKQGDFKELWQDLMRLAFRIEPEENSYLAILPNFNNLPLHYRRLWQKIFSTDMFQTRFSGENLLSSKVGKDFRNKILKAGGTEDAYDLICRFLGRKPTVDAFLRFTNLEDEFCFV